MAKDMSLTMQELPKNASANAYTKSKHSEWMTIRPVENRQHLELSQKRTVFIRILLKTENLFGFARDKVGIVEKMNITRRLTRIITSEIENALDRLTQWPAT